MGAEGRTLYPHCKQFLHWRKNVKCERPNLAKRLSIHLAVTFRLSYDKKGHQMSQTFGN